VGEGMEVKRAQKHITLETSASVIRESVEAEENILKSTNQSIQTYINRNANFRSHFRFGLSL
jgi:nicotinic acid mononucleotide adenylyltransferase